MGFEYVTSFSEIINAMFVYIVLYIILIDLFIALFCFCLIIYKYHSERWNDVLLIAKQFNNSSKEQCRELCEILLLDDRYYKYPLISYMLSY